MARGVLMQEVHAPWGARSTHGLVGYDVASTRRRSSVRIRVAVLLRVPLRALPLQSEKADEGGVRTHASEEIAALTQRLRPLGHLATCSAPCTSEKYTHSDSNRGPSPC